MCRNVLTLCATVAALVGTTAQAAPCSLPPVAPPPGFPDQPINIIIPRSQTSGALTLSTSVAQNMPEIALGPDRVGPPEVNILFKSDGDLPAALAYFSRLPANGYNVIQLNDTYASLLAEDTLHYPPLVPISVAQVTFSQIYMRSVGTEFMRDRPGTPPLEALKNYALSPDKPPVTIANFRGAEKGLEDFLIEAFIDANGLAYKIAEDGTPTGDPALVVQSYESGSERYFSMFTKLRDRPQSDLLIEQPGDIARLMEAEMLTPIFTLLPKSGVTEEMRARFGELPTLPESTDPAAPVSSCQVHYRYRGFFVSAEVPDAHREFLEWLFHTAINSAEFQAINAREFVDLLYGDPQIARAYCSGETGRAVFRQSIENYRQCRSNPSTH